MNCTGPNKLEMYPTVLWQLESDIIVIHLRQMDVDTLSSQSDRVNVYT